MIYDVWCREPFMLQDILPRLWSGYCPYQVVIKSHIANTPNQKCVRIMMNLFPMQREEHVPQFSNPNGLVSGLFLGFSKVLGCKFWPGTLSHRTFQAFLYSQVYAYSSDHRFLIPTRKYWFCFHWFGCGFIWLSGYNYLVESFLPAKETCFVSWPYPGT